MMTFLISCLLLAVAYVVYGNLLENWLGVDESRPVPSRTHFDGVDFVPMSWPRAFLIQLLNIAGLGPVFGAVMGALFGPVAFLWIVFGGIFIGATHDFVAAFVSMRENGASLTELIGRYLGKPVRIIMTALTLVLLMLVGVAFVLGPARIMADVCGSGAIQTASALTPESSGIDSPMPATITTAAITTTVSTTAASAPVSPLPPNPVTGSASHATLPGGIPAPVVPASAPLFATTSFWAVVIFLYYILATLLPIDQLIGRIYPVFGAALLIKAVLVTVLILTGRLVVPELTLENLHPEHLPVWPVMMITIACGAISGFHATQSPLMVRVLTSERYTRRVFFGAMLVESFIALVWAAAAMGFVKGSTIELARILGPKGDAVVLVKSIGEMLGPLGIPLVLLGVVALPVTTGDTAYRSARLIIADALGLEQKSFGSRLLICVPMFLLGVALCQLDFKIIWKYFAWLNQTLAVFTLWAITVWLKRNGKPVLITAVPAVFMSMVVISYIVNDPKTGFGLSMPVSVTISGLCAALFAWGSWKRSSVELPPLAG